MPPSRRRQHEQDSEKAEPSLTTVLDELALIRTTRTLPLRYAYLGAAGRAHVQFARTAGYRDVTLMTHEEAACLRWADLTAAVDVCEIGPGDGRHSVAILNVLKPPPDRYLALDVSDYLLEVAKGRLEGPFSDTKFDTASWDFEAGATSAIDGWRGEHGLLILFLGQTLGNTRMPGAVLRNLRASAEPGDSLLVSVALHDERLTEAEQLRPYDNEAFTRGNIASLESLGVDPQRATFRLDWQGQAVLGIVHMADPMVHDGWEVLPAGSEITTFYSRRFTRDSLAGVFVETGWEVSTATMASGPSHIAAVARAI